MDRLGLFEFARRNSRRACGVALCAVAAFCGCQSQNPTDPFKGRATIPPPGTNFAPPPGGQPYYTPPVSNNTRPPAMQPNFGQPPAMMPPTLSPTTYPNGAMPAYPVQGYPAQNYPAYPPNGQPAPNGFGAPNPAFNGAQPMGSGFAPQGNPQFNGTPGVIANPGASPSWPSNTSPSGPGTVPFNSGSAIPNYPANRNPFAWQQQQNPYPNPNAVPTGYSPNPTSWPANGVATQPGTPVNMQGYTPPTASIPSNALVQMISPRSGGTSAPAAQPLNGQYMPVSTSVSNPPIVTIPAASIPPANVNAMSFQEPRRLDSTVTTVDISDLKPVNSPSTSGSTTANRPTLDSSLSGTSPSPTADIPLVPRN